MFSSLPTELLRQILESLIPNTFHTTTYNKRQQTLRQYSIVAERFYAVIQPLLPEIVWINSNAQFDSLLLLKAQDSPRQVILDGDLDLNRLQMQLSIFRGLKSLTIHRDHGEALDLNGLCNFPNLTKMQLCGNSYSLSTPHPLSSLQALSIDYRAAQVVSGILDPTHLPSLQALGLDLITSEAELEALGNTAISNLLPQIDALSIYLALYDIAKDSLLADLSSRILVDLSADRFEDVAEALPTVQHLRIDTGSKTKMQVVDGLSNYLESKEHSQRSYLRSIYFDTSILPTHSDSREYSGRYQEMVKMCGEWQIELVFEAQRYDYNLDSYISEEFWRRQRERRRKEKEAKK